MNPGPFSRSVRLLAHPLSLAAIALMLANDFVFKPLWPSWWTGKLSDFAGLFFLPFLLAALFALLLPGRWSGRAAGLAFGVTGAGFALLKLSPLANAFLLDAFHTLSGIQLQARPDPTDLLALFSLLPAAWLWRAASAGNAASFPLWRLLVLPLAALVTLADAAAPDLGVACLQVDGGGIVATTQMYSPHIFRSQDGGLSWEAQPLAGPSTCQPQPAPLTPLQDPASGTVYRFIPGQGIERSQDAGQSWQADYSFTANEADRAYLKLARGGNLSWGAQPSAALVDPASGNLILAMGLDGVLVHPPGAGWRPAPVGDYRPDSLRQAGAGGLLFLLQAQLSLAILAGFGWLFTRAARQLGRFKVWVILGWAALAGVSLLLTPPVLTDGYLRAGSAIALVGFALALLIFLAIAAAALKGGGIRLLLSALPQMALVILACFLPYLLWGLQLLPTYTPAFLASTALVALLLLLFSLRRREGI